ncbi:MAG: hypothetical protein PHP01_09820 [Phycisphaerae bacterium]|nr:hypothetical protein [Phycisphaerae bacterium]
MVITDIDSVLAERSLGIPILDALIPNEANYKVMLLQPKGEIEGSHEGVKNKDRSLAYKQFSCFLKDAQACQADLVVTPEYSMPWEVLKDAINSDIHPAQGKLWALGCESIKYSELANLKNDLSAKATLIFETLVPDSTRFTDPLAYVFLAPRQDESETLKLVVLVQFKTAPMADNDHFEINGLQKGKKIYRFGGSDGQEIKLLSFICSDAFPFFNEGHAQSSYDRSLIIHIQLNPKPRQVQYKQYREALFYCGGHATELICLNWAENVHECCGANRKPWHNIAGSAWYLQPDKYDDRDATLCANHKRGLYYTWSNVLRSHALFFNYCPATFILTATKVFHLNVANSVSRLRGPQLTETRLWCQVDEVWNAKEQLSDGFTLVVHESGDAKEELKRLAEASPVSTERLLALCTGNTICVENWHNLQQLDSFVIDSSEVIRRLTFCMDKDPCVIDFKNQRLRRLKRLWTILKDGTKLPKALDDLNSGFKLDWTVAFPHQNVISDQGQRATVMYMGEDVSKEQVEATAVRMAEFLRRHYKDPDDCITARQRLVVFFRDGDDISPFEAYRFVKIDQTRTTPGFDIGRES